MPPPRGEERLVEVGQGVHPGLLGPLGEVVVVEQPGGRDAPGVLEDLAAVVGQHVAVAAGHGGRPAQRATRLLVQQPGQEQRVAPDMECVDQLGQPRVLGERLGRHGWLGHVLPDHQSGVVHPRLFSMVSRPRWSHTAGTTIAA
jgi:hypothetical protein